MTKRKLPKLKRIKSKDSRPRVRRTWTINPSEQIVENKKERKPSTRQLTEDALEEYNEATDND